MRRDLVLKVRLSDDELARLDRFRLAYGFPSRASAVRVLLSAAQPPEVTDAPVPGPSLDTLLEGFQQPWTPEGL